MKGLNMNKGTKSLIFYIAMILVFGSLIYFFIVEGNHHNSEAMTTFTNMSSEYQGDSISVFFKFTLEHIQSPFGILLLQIIVILLCCRFFSAMFLKIKQPAVIGEILAGIILGPSILGYWMPCISEFLFPAASLDNLGLLSQFGLILFMFAIGMELNITEVRNKLKETILISHASIIVPFFFGVVLAYFIYSKYADEGTPFLSFALFIGIALSITAFPVLARIIQEKGLTKTYLGTISLASAANGDIIAWCMLAVIVSIAQAGTILSAAYNILFSGIYVMAMFFIIRPFLRMVGQVYHNEEVIDKGLVAFVFLILVMSSFLTEILGLHALFGAFVAGVVMPSDIKFRKIMAEKVEAVSLSLFLPLFFVLTGLKTEIGLLNTPELWGMCGIFILVAILGKFGGASIAARAVGESWRNSLYIGALMNTRGLMELVVLTIGYEMHILSSTVFVMLVLMTLFTTFMTTPLLYFIKSFYRRRARSASHKTQEHTEKTFKIMLSFGRAGNGQIMLKVLHQMFSVRKEHLDITALHFTSGADVNPLQIDSFETVSFAPILDEAQKSGINIQTRYEISNNVSEDIMAIVNEEKYHFLLVGAGINWSNLPNDIAANQYLESAQGHYLKPLAGVESWFFPNSLLKDKTKMFIEQANCTVGVLINRDFVSATRVLIVIDSERDLFLLRYAQNLLTFTHGMANILCRSILKSQEKWNVGKKIKQFIETNRYASLLPDDEITSELLKKYNFMLISYVTWNDVSECDREALQQMPSTLIISEKTRNGE
ncbi:MAG: cation:proton antiporter [Dysgonamonadaceae bacterium]|jgi:Kef-type K+ transport system membrane component KefB|nr:cation:proton antiporter [Dysgonamonadaceae bacterium]